MMADQGTQTSWRNGVPVSKRFDDSYYSLDHGPSETAHVFLDGNHLPARFRPNFQIAELGFGTGLNLVVALTAWRQAGFTDPLRFTSFEAFPLETADMRQALAAFPEFAEISQPLVDALAKPARDAKHEIHWPDLHLQVLLGDARETLPNWTGQADAWFLDGFSPAKNPELWEPALLRDVACHTAPQGTCATYTAAGAVRRALESAGFEVSRGPGYGRKRHMTRGVLA